jgi:hypothetical protein
VHGIARQEHAALAVAVGDHAAAHPMADREDLEIEVAAGSAAYLGGRVDRLRFVDFLAMDHQPPALPAVGRREARPWAFRPDQHEAAGIALRVDGGEVGRAQHHVDRAVDERHAAHLDAERLAHR